jgi:Ca-activated chloride channel family protein
MIRLLNADDRVNVISFSDEVDPLFSAPQALTVDTRTAATAFVHRLHAGGGTDIALALQTSLKAQQRGGEHPRIVVFLTDGQSDAAKAAAVDLTGVRLFTLGLGDDVNKPLLSHLAAQQHGRFVFIGDAKSIESEVGRLAASIAKPLLVDVAVEVVGANATRMYPRSLPDLFAEDELRVSGRLRGTGTVKFIIRGKLAGKPVEFARTADLGSAPRRPWIASLWAQSRVDHLLEEIALGGTESTEQKNEVIELALAYNFITPYTAFLAVPESELGAEASTVAAMRERKQKVLADNSEVQALRDHNHADFSASPDLGADASDDSNAPKMRKLAMAPSNDNDAEEVLVTGSSHHHGCAGCATGSDGGGALLLVVAALVMRRRRR